MEQKATLYARIQSGEVDEMEFRMIIREIQAKAYSKAMGKARKMPGKTNDKGESYGREQINQ